MPDEHEFDDPTGVVDALMHMNAMLTPIVDWAVGFRAMLTEQGWPIEIANEISGDVMRRVITMGLNGASPE